MWGPASTLDSCLSLADICVLRPLHQLSVMENGVKAGQQCVQVRGPGDVLAVMNIKKKKKKTQNAAQQQQ